MSSAVARPAPLDDAMLTMDVADTLRRNQDLVAGDVTEDARDTQLLEKLRRLYERQGIEVSDAALRSGVAALGDSRFTYTPKSGFGAFLARAYVVRARWLRIVTAVALMLVISVGGYFLVYKPYHNGQLEAARIELAETMPAQMDALYQTIFDETKVQQAANDASDIRDRGKLAAQQGDRAGAEAAIADLTTIRDTLRLEYRLSVVNRAGVKFGFWIFPESNTEATNYYLVVEALDPQGKPLSLPIRNENTAQTETVALWGLRVPEDVYRSVEADKNDDGVVENNLVGVKQSGFLEPEYVVATLGGAVTRW